MTTVPSRATLRRVLLLDGATCALTGAILAAASGPLASLTAIPQPLLLYAGLVLLPLAAFMALVATREPIPSPGVRLIVIGNVAWVLASLALSAGLIRPNALGHALIIGQALAVAVLAWLELEGVRHGAEPVAGGA